MKKILVVDDTVSTLKITARLFRSHGYEVIEATDGLDALACLREANEPFSGVVSDKDMPNMNGVDLLSTIRKWEATHEIPFILLSGGLGVVSETDPTPLKTYCHTQGKAVFLAKPYDVDELFALVRKLF